MSLKIVVLAKQVPDTRNVGKDAMKEDGTINRAALPAIFNPEDLNALEQALQLKEQKPGIDDYPAYDGSSSCRRNYSGRFIPWSGRRYRIDRPCLCRSRHIGYVLRTIVCRTQNQRL